MGSVGARNCFQPRPRGPGDDAAQVTRPAEPGRRRHRRLASMTPAEGPVADGGGTAILRVSLGLVVPSSVRSRGLDRLQNSIFTRQERNSLGFTRRYRFSDKEPISFASSHLHAPQHSGLRVRLESAQVSLTASFDGIFVRASPGLNRFPFTTPSVQPFRIFLGLVGQPSPNFRPTGTGELVKAPSPYPATGDPGQDGLRGAAMAVEWHTAIVQHKRGRGNQPAIPEAMADEKKKPSC